MQMASTSGEAMSSRQSPNTLGMSNSLATRSPDAVLRLATPTSTTPGWARSLGM